MLTENDVVEAITVFLKADSYNIDQALSTNEKGIDIEATHPQKGRCFVEAKGATSSKETSKRYGKLFTGSQVKSHIGVALVASFRTLQLYPEALVAMALPNNEGHKSIIEEMITPIMDSGIRGFLVNDDLSIEVFI